MPDSLRLRLGRRRNNLNERLVVFYNGIDFGDMEQRVPEDSRHMAIYLNDKPLGTTGGGRDIVMDCPKAEKAGFVHGRNGSDRNVNFHEIPDQSGNLVEFIGNEIVQSTFHQLSISTADKPRICRKAVP